jgi:polyhydroxybutyrate depolymerase
MLTRHRGTPLTFPCNVIGGSRAGNQRYRPDDLVVIPRSCSVRARGPRWSASRGAMLLTLLLASSATACARLLGARPLVPGALEPGDSYHTIQVGDRARTYLLHLPPAYDRPHHGPALLPVLLMFHGSGTNGSWLKQQTELDREADRRHFAVVYPDGSGALGYAFLDWPSGDTTADVRADVASNIHFIDTLIHTLAHLPGLDGRRIYAAGLSNGAIMTYTLGCALAGELAGIAPVAGEMPDSTCAPSRPLPVLVIHGTADDVIPYENHGQRQSGETITYRSDPEAVAFWVRRDGCASIPRTTTHGHIVRESFTGCANGTAVVFYTVKGGTHEWPGGRRSWLFGHLPTRELSASKAILQFFSHHAAPP